MKQFGSVVLAWFVAFAARADVIKVASGSMLSGSQSNLGEMIKLGAQLAIEEAQERFKSLGFDLRFSPQDDQASPDVGVAVARRLVNDPDVLAIVGHFNSGVTIPTSEVYKDFDLVMVSPGSTDVRVTDRGLPNVNRVCGRDDIQGPVGAEFVVNELKAKRILVIHDKSAYGQGLADNFREKATALGANIVGTIGTEEKSSFRDLTLQMRRMNPDVVYFGGIYDQGGLLLRQMRAQRIQAAFVGGDGLESSAFVDIAQQASVGAHYTSVAGPPDKYPGARAFGEAFRAKYGRAPEGYSLYAYDAAQVVLKALETCIAANGGKKPTRRQVMEAVRAVELGGITGPIAFNSRGDRRQADYWVIKFEEAKYPGTGLQYFTKEPPAPESGF